MKSGGFILFHRKVWEHQMSPVNRKTSFTEFEALWYLISLANYDVGTFCGEKVQRGQCIISQRKMSEMWRWSRNKVKRFLDRLEADGTIKYNGKPGRDGATNGATNGATSSVKNEATGYTHVTFCNYEVYQSNQSRKTDQTEPPKIGGAEPPTEPQVKHNKINKEYKEEENSMGLIQEDKTDHQTFIDKFARMFEERTGVEFDFAHGPGREANGKTVKHLLGQYGLDKSLEIAKAMFDSNDPYYNKCGFTLNILRKQAQALAVNITKGKDEYVRTFPK